MLLPWLDDQKSLFAEMGRVLRAGGLFAFSSLGPSSFSELAEAWQEVDPGWHVRQFPDMHNTGDALLAAGLADPVLDVDFVDVSYRSVDALLKDLQGAGARNSLRGRRATLADRQRLDAFRAALERQRIDGEIRLRLELVYGHAFGRGSTPGSGEYRIAADAIGRRERQ